MLAPEATDVRIAIASNEPKVARHALAERLFHWILAASFLTLLVSAFGPIFGWRFDWVPLHVGAGIVLILAVLLHLWRALFSLDFWSMMIDRADLRNALRGLVSVVEGRGPLPGKPAKYEVGQKLFHWGIAGLVLVLIATGLLMLAKLDTPFWQRNPYWLSEFTWGIIYTIHDLFAVLAVSMIILHLYFVLRPHTIFLLRSMVTGWITRREYLDDFDPQRWRPEELKE